jgi:hypothetical protein
VPEDPDDDTDFELPYQKALNEAFMNGLCKESLYFSVASRNNDRTVAGKSFAWRLLGMMPSFQRQSGGQTEGIDILAEQINDLTGLDMFFRFEDQKYDAPVYFWIFSAWTGTRCQMQQCVLHRSARLAGVFRAFF